MSLSPLSFVVVVGVETNKGKLFIVFGLQLVSIYQVLSGMFWIGMYISDRNHYQGIHFISQLES